MALSTDPGEALNGARQLSDAQAHWLDRLEQGRPELPLSAFGLGLQAQGALLMEQVRRGHEVRMAHARRLRNAADDGAALIRRVQRADTANAGTLGGGDFQ